MSAKQPPAEAGDLEPGQTVWIIKGARSKRAHLSDDCDQVRNDELEFRAVEAGSLFDDCPICLCCNGTQDNNNKRDWTHFQRTLEATPEEAGISPLRPDIQAMSRRGGLSD